MSMGDLNADPIFLEMMMKLQMKWDALAKERGFKIFASKITVDWCVIVWAHSQADSSLPHNSPGFP